MVRIVARRCGVYRGAVIPFCRGTVIAYIVVPLRRASWRRYNVYCGAFEACIMAPLWRESRRPCSVKIPSALTELQKVEAITSYAMKCSSETPLGPDEHAG